MTNQLKTAEAPVAEEWAVGTPLTPTPLPVLAASPDADALAKHDPSASEQRMLAAGWVVTHRLGGVAYGYSKPDYESPGPVTWSTVARLRKSGLHDVADIARRYARKNCRQRARRRRWAMRLRAIGRFARLGRSSLHG